MRRPHPVLNSLALAGVAFVITFVAAFFAEADCSSILTCPFSFLDNIFNGTSVLAALFGLSVALVVFITNLRHRLRQARRPSDPQTPLQACPRLEAVGIDGVRPESERAATVSSGSSVLPEGGSGRGALTLSRAWKALRAWCSHGVGRWVYSILFLASVAALTMLVVPFLLKVLFVALFVGAMSH
jgi:hypothetical protein